MKKILIVLSTVFSLNAFATEFSVGNFEMYNQPFHRESGCDIGSNLILDKTILKGDIVLMSNFVKGLCEIYVMKNQIYFDVISVESAGCGSKLIKAHRDSLNEGRVSLEIIDHRTRMCRDMVKAMIIVKKTKSETGEVSYLYSKDR